MKKLLALILALGMAVGTAACSSNNKGGSTGGGGDFTVDVFIYSYADTYISSVRNAMENEFKAVEGLDYTFYDAGNDQGKQTQQIETAITKGSDLLIVNIVTTGSEDAAQNIINAAQEKDIPVIFFNREVSDDIIKSYDKAAFVGTDADEAGYLQGELIYDLLSEKYDEYDLNGDGAISYIMFKGELGNAEADGRTKYSVEEANKLLTEKGKPELKYYDANNKDLYQAANWESAEAQDAMATAIGTNPYTGNNPIEMVIANNDGMALGAVEALNEAGYNTGSGKFIPVVGVDATDEAKDAIAQGKMSGTIKQDAEGMAKGIAFLASNVKDGKELMDATDSFNVDEDVDKIRIPYGKYTGK